ncbi:TetR/AcrR family transcriptional regulator [Nocardia camponoti]|uniref:HTH tetR-type domain-containing protein n=1 Tax=Nocardia camponoti TaxID=1616106 RepID=A0A917V529_9NOCA|nr:TetR/AcrR family transcriptional regulator [Nocardia camponoti]GGK38840.1 hypothetical protein GCM10011591_08200 [Nocardia camponoti]
MMPPQPDKQRKRPRQDRAKETRTHILATAAHLFGERGITETSTNRIAAEAEISVGTLYRYFADREEIVKELNDGLFTRVETRYGELLPAITGLTPQEAVTEILRAAVEILVAEGPLVRALVTDLNFYGSGIPDFEPRFRFILKVYILNAIGLQPGVDVDTIAFVALNAGFAVTLRSVYLENEGFDRETVIAQTAEMIGTWIATKAQVP